MMSQYIILHRMHILDDFFCGIVGIRPSVCIKNLLALNPLGH